MTHEKEKLISKKKRCYSVSQKFDRYLRQFGRGCLLPLDYDELLRFNESFPVFDKQDNDTLWVSVSYHPSEDREIRHRLLKIYAFLRTGGEMDRYDHLRVDRIDLCLYGNTKPFRIRIINGLNDNFDYFYIKKADASRLFGLELEHILSPNRISFLYYQDTIVEEHIYGIPGDVFLGHYLNQPGVNMVRMSKEFVKFNERCFLRLLGDMHSSNFVVDVTMDFEENFYRLRAIDFDQQCYEPRKKVYLPQFFAQNYSYVEIAAKYLSETTVKQYQKEERSQIRQRLKVGRYRFDQLMECFLDLEIAPKENRKKLGLELAKHYRDDNFLLCNTMAALVKHSLLRLENI